MAEKEVDMLDGCPSNPGGDSLSVYVRIFQYADSGFGRVRFECHRLIDGGGVVKELTAVSPRKTWEGSSMAVVGEFLYIAGGRKFIKTIEIGVDEYEHQSHFCCIDTSRGSWAGLAHLLTPRNLSLLVPSINGDRIYAIGDVHDYKLLYDEDEHPPEEHPHSKWAEVFDIKTGKWDYHVVELGGDCKSLPWNVHWYARIPHTNKIYFLGLEKLYHKLYYCDLDKKQCCFFDEDFGTNFRKLIQSPGISSDFLMPNQTLENKAALCGNFLYLAGRDFVFCYKLLDKKWVTQPVGGLSFHRDIFDWYQSPIDTKIIYLGSRIFGVVCYECCGCIVSWVKVTISDDHQASILTRPKRFLVNNFYGDLDCFLMPDEYNNNPTENKSPGKKKSWRKRRGKR